MLRILQLSLLSLLLPVSEIYFFRWLFHQPFFLVRPGLPGFVDADLILPGFFSVAFFLFLLEKAQTVELIWSRRWATVNALTVLVFWGSSRVPHFAASPLWWCLFTSMWVSAFFVRIPPSHLFRNRNWPGILPSFLIADSLVIVKQLYESTWPYFGVASAQTICSVLHQLDSQAVCRWANPKALALMHPQINVLIGPPCSGVDVFFLFLIASCVYLVVDTERPSFWFGAGILIGGVATAFLLNVVRVVSIFTLSLLANRVFGSATLGMDIFVGFFHAHAGWVIYTLGCIGYFSCIPYLRQRHFFVALRHNLNV